MDKVILVDESDRVVGESEKLKAHKDGLLHRAFSIFIFNSDNKLLIHKRAANKYHSAGLWTNTCCSHPKPGETTIEAAIRRLNEEMGMHCKLNFAFSFVYETTFDNGLIEHEYDHVFIGVSDELPTPNPTEVSDWQYANLQDIQTDIQNRPSEYTEWFKICVTEYNKKLVY